MVILKKIINFLYIEKRKKIILVKGDTKFSYLNLKKKKNKIFLLIFKYNIINIMKILKLLFLCKTNYKIEKNFIIVFTFKNEIIIHKFYLNWKSGKHLNFYENFIFWMKKNLFIYFRIKNISHVIIKLK